MKLRIAATIALLLGGVAVWLVSNRQSRTAQPLDQVTSEGGSSSRRAANAVPAISPEGNPRVPEEIEESAANAPPQSAVLPKAKPVSIAAVDESAPMPEPADADVTSVPPATALENMRVVLRQYAIRFGGNPVGSNREITSALKGENAGQVTFVDSEDGLRLNAQGELVDNWNTPYFFHQLSRNEMEIRSAGPDRRMWTSDDLVIK